MPASSTTSRSAAAARCWRRRWADTSRPASAATTNSPRRSPPASCARSRSPSDKRLPGVDIPTLKEQGDQRRVRQLARPHGGRRASPRRSGRSSSKTVAKMVKTRSVEGHPRRGTTGSTCSCAGDEFKAFVESRTEERAGKTRQHARPGEEMHDARSRDPSPASLLISLGLIALGTFVVYETQSIAETQGYAQIGPRLFPTSSAPGSTLCGAVSAWQALSGGWRHVPLDQEGHDAPGLDRIRRSSAPASSCTW